MEIVAKRLRELRIAKNYTQEKLGQLVNIHKSAICHFENNDRVPPLEILIKLADVFNVSLDYFVGNDYFAISEDNEKYGMKLSKEEMNFIKLIRNDHKLYSELINSPENLIDRMKIKL